MKKLLGLLAVLCVAVACSKPVPPSPPPAPSPTVVVVPPASSAPVIKPSPAGPGLPGGGHPGPIATKPAPVAPKPPAPAPPPCFIEKNGVKVPVNCPHVLPKPPAAPKVCKEGETKGVAVGGSPTCVVCHDGKFVPGPCSK